MYLKGRHLREHVMHYCTLRDKNNQEENKKALKVSKQFSIVSVFKEEIGEEIIELVETMLNDDVVKKIRNDDLILYIGQIYMNQMGDDESSDHVRQRMRLLAKLLIEMKPIETLQEIMLV